VTCADAGCLTVLSHRLSHGSIIFFIKGWTTPGGCASAEGWNDRSSRRFGRWSWARAGPGKVDTSQELGAPINPFVRMLNEEEIFVRVKRHHEFVQKAFCAQDSLEWHLKSSIGDKRNPRGPRETWVVGQAPVDLLLGALRFPSDSLRVRYR
jgi:hypothetical protein